MKLLMISGDRSILEGRKGAFWYTLQELRKHWERIDIITPRPKPVEKHQEIHHDLKEHHEGAPVFFHPSPASLISQPKWILQKGKELHAEFGHDVMTVHEYPPFYNGIGAQKLAKAVGIPYALEIHHIIGYPMPASLSERVGLFLSRLYLPRESKNATAIRTVNGDVKQHLADWGVDEQKIKIVPSFYLDGDVIRSAKQVPVTYDIVFCARLVPNKGLKELIDAVAQLPNRKLMVVGDGPIKNEMEAYAKEKDVRSRTTFTGWLPDHESVIEAIKGARVFVMNSKSEGGPRVLLEAMGAGMPVVATPVGIVPDVIQDGYNGLLTTGEPDDLKIILGTLLEDAERRASLGEEAQKILDRFDRSTLVKGYADFLKALV